MALAVWDTSSSGWACRKTMVDIAGSSHGWMQGARRPGAIAVGMASRPDLVGDDPQRRRFEEVAEVVRLGLAVVDPAAGSPARR